MTSQKGVLVMFGPRRPDERLAVKGEAWELSKREPMPYAEWS